VATDRLFFALRPDAAAAARMHELALGMRESFGLMGRLVPVEHLHVTVCFLGDHTGLAPQTLAAADTAARELRAQPFELEFDAITSFDRARGAAPLVLCRYSDCAPLSRLQADLARSCAASGRFPTESRPFRPHVTLLYDRQRVQMQRVAPIGWSAAELVLVVSRIGRGVHEVLCSYPLTIAATQA
jgi:2'-5' RNA ligase